MDRRNSTLPRWSAGHAGRRRLALRLSEDDGAATAAPLLRFWFRFVFPYMSYIRHMGPEQAFKDLIRPHLDGYYGQCFERLCREALPELYRREGVHAPFEIGEYWSKTTQIDVVGLREDNWTDLGECKWGPVRSPEAVAREPKPRSRNSPIAGGATIGRRIFSRQRPQGGAVAWVGGDVWRRTRSAPPGRLRTKARGAK